MKASPSDQRSILDIQRFDQQATSLRHKASTLPELAELASTTVKSNNARDLRIAAETELNDVKRELARAEGDVEQIVTRITRDEARLNGGSASPKELEQLQHEVGTLGARRAELEKVAQEKLSACQAVGEKLKGQLIEIHQKAGVDGRLFGSVTNHDISDSLVQKGFTIEKGAVRLPNGPLKAVGEYPIAIALHTDAVARTQMVRSKFIVKMFRLAGTAPLPVTYEFESDVL